MRFALALLGVSSVVACRADEMPSAGEQQAIDALVRLGGKADIDPKLAPEARVAAKLESADDGLLLALKKHPQIGAIEVLDATRCTAKGYSGLKDVPELRRLVLSKCNMTPLAVTAIAQCKELRHLALVEAGLTDAGLAPLKKLALLEHLSLSNNSRITDKGMLTVKSFERLQMLYLANTAITDKGLWELKGLDGLRTLNVANTKVTADAAEKFVDEMPNLRSIRK